LVALFCSHYAGKVPHDKPPTGSQIKWKKYAVVSNSIAITINLSVLLIFFVFVPITLASDGKMTWDYFWTSKTIAFILSTIAILGHFFFASFVMIEDDYTYITGIHYIWIAVNLFFEDSKGVLFSELNGTKNVIKMSLAVFVVISTTCFYQILCPISQRIKGLDEKRIKH
jgi:hypothetical protein